MLTCAAATVARAFGPATTPSSGFDSFHVGNSFTWGDRQLQMVSGIANQAGHNHDMSWSIILGASLQYIWENPGGSGSIADGEKFTDALVSANRWEALVLQHFPPGTDAVANAFYAGNFYNLALQGNPDCQAYLFNIWPDHATMYNPPLNRTHTFSLSIAAEFDKLFPGKPPIIVIPAGEVIRELALLADNGQLPGVANRVGLFKDAGHLNRIGSYAVAATHIACLFHEDPRSYPATVLYPPSHPQAGQVVEAINPATAAVILDTIWQVLNTRARTGFDPNLTFTTAFLPGALANQSYSTTLQASGGIAPYTFSIASGTLPAGLGLNTNSGLIQGTVGGPSVSNLTLRVADSTGKVADKNYTLAIEENTAPAITTVTLPPLSLGAHAVQTITVAGGNLPLTWSLAAGRLPQGMTLSMQGSIIGVPVEQGTFSITVKVRDNDGQESLKPLSIVVGAVNPATTQVAERIIGTPRIDGLLDDAAWSGGGFVSVGQVATGSPAATATFKTLWNGSSLLIGVDVNDSTARTDSTDYSEDDSIELYFDGLNDKERVYNNDDRRIVVRRDGVWTSQGQHTLGVYVATVEKAGGTGYTAEIKIDFVHFPNALGFLSSLGFDLAINDDTNGGAAEGRRIWFGSLSNESDTSFFGNLLLQNTAGNYGVNGLVHEAEDASLLGRFVVRNDATASGGKYATTPNGSGDNTAAADANQQMLFRFNQVPPGTYKITATVRGPSGTDDSYYVRVAQGPVWTYDTYIGSGFRAHDVVNRGKVGAATFVHNWGPLEIAFMNREDGVWLDKVTLVKVAEPVAGTFGAWWSGRFSAAEKADPVLSGPAGELASLGTPNAIIWFFNTPHPVVTDAAGFQVTVPKDRLGATWQMLATTDFNAPWQPAADVLGAASITAGGTADTHTWPLPATLPRVFVRVTVTLTP